MTRSRIFVFVLLLVLLGSCGHACARPGEHPGRQRRRQPDFSGQHCSSRPSSRPATNITSVVLEYGVNQLTCGTVDAKAFPQVTPGTDVKVIGPGKCSSPVRCRRAPPSGGTGW